MSEHPSHDDPASDEQSAYEHFDNRLREWRRKWRQRPSKWFATPLEVSALLLGFLTLCAIVVTGVFAYQNWQALETSNALNREAYGSSQRAWLRIHIPESDAKTTIAAMSQWAFVARVANHGHQSARNVVVFSNVELPNRNEPPSLEYNGLHLRTRIGLLSPDESTPIEIEMKTPDGLVVPITKRQRDDLAAGTRYLAVFAKISYLDDFGLHWAHVCTWASLADGLYQAENCMKYNATGDGADATK